ncbi:MAG: phosphoglycerate dehydrogenase [Desulfitobacterium sp.]|nr:phosphoglycerate dehydrogenase [Desulfitobacterium sp.]
MYKIHTMNKISEKGLENFTDKYVRVERFEDANAILVRSAKMHDLDIPNTVEAIARAGAGVNNIPLEKCADKGIVVFNTPGANANAVKELVIASMILAARNILGGINWVNSCSTDPDVAQLVEKNKSQFAGTEIKGKKLGVIGLGAIGALVANSAIKLGMEVYGYDPFISVEHAWRLSKWVKPIQTLEEIYRECDFITIHVPLTESNKGMLNKEAFDQMKDGVIILNFSRDGLVEDMAMREAIESGKVAKYVTDFPNSLVCGIDRVITIPHLGASTVESEENCAQMAVSQVMDYLENGNIRNSVNYPNCDMGVCMQAGRIAINHRNIPNMLGQFTSTLAQENVNISDLMNKSKGAFAYTLIDIETPTTEEMANKLRQIDGVLRVRIIK